MDHFHALNKVNYHFCVLPHSVSHHKVLVRVSDTHCLKKKKK